MRVDAAAREELRGALLSLGFDVVRFARVSGEAPGARALRAWLAEGGQADMAWIGRNVERRVDPRLVVPGALTVLMLGVNYQVARARSGSGPRVARYAWFEDYHDSLAPALAAARRGAPGRCQPRVRSFSSGSTCLFNASSVSGPVSLRRTTPCLSITKVSGTPTTP